MKIRSLLLIFITMLTVLALFSCKAKSNGQNGGGQINDEGNSDVGGGSADNNAGKGNVIYNSETSIAIVRPLNENKEVNELILSVYESLFGRVKGAPEIITASESAREHEIVIGKSDRPVSVEAYRRLENMRLSIEQEQAGDPRILIYTDGKSVAIAYDEYLGQGQAHRLRYNDRHNSREQLSSQCQPHTHRKQSPRTYRLYR